MKLEDWQEYVLWAWHDIDDAGKWAASECGLLVSRQNGKSEALVAFDLARLFLFPLPDKRRRTVLHTAHEVKTATETFEKLASIIEANDRLMSLVDHVYTANGKEAIVLKKRRGQLLGDRVRFVARSKKSGRGFAATDVVYDEAQELPVSARKALTYTQSTIPNRQEIYVGTVPSDENDGEVFEGVRDRGRRGASRVIWQEWSPEGAEDPKLAKLIDVEDPEVWKQSIPAMGTWIHPTTVAEQVDRAADRDELLQERFAVWPNRAEEVAEKLSELDLEMWKRHAGDYPVQGDGGVIAIAVGRGGGYATISKAIRLDSDHIAVEHHKTDRKVRWVADEVKALKAGLGNALVVVDPKNAAMILADLDRAGIKYLAMHLDEIAAAHSIFIEMSNDGLVLHRDQPEVTKSLELATTRAIGRAGFTWEPSDPTKPISHAQSVTWAVWGVIKSEASPKKRTPPPPKAAVLTRDSVARDEVDLRSAGF
ncbi:hypothetical protein [Leucobacter massiliensis]|uniref:Terminase n=1 Tax=Leucobacter massiliensis TaxID=1686285 RepID=A0A2S9QMY5_9MICO|nr:hypothetical protein [Leucobacter massiliensis]PRI10927.1 hypothetical protein B4915_08570 [Leucobacter massiliensis]